MSETRNENSPADEHDDDAKRQEMAEQQEKLDAQSDGEGLAAEAAEVRRPGSLRAERPRADARDSSHWLECPRAGGTEAEALVGLSG